MWPDLVIVHGKPRHPQSQGSIEWANGDVEDMIRSWLNDKQTTNWATGLKFVQLQKNTAVNRILGTSPYKALFGQDPSVGLCTDFPCDVLDALRPESEEDLLRLCTSAGPGRTDGDPEHAPIVNANIPADGDGGGGRQHDNSITAHGVGASEELLADENAVLGTIPDDAAALIDNDDSEENINDAFPETALSILSALASGGLRDERDNVETHSASADGDVETRSADAGMVTPSADAGVVTLSAEAGVVTPSTDARVVTLSADADVVTLLGAAGVVTPSTDARVVTLSADADVVTLLGAAGVVTPSADAGVVTLLASADDDVETRSADAGVETLTNCSASPMGLSARELFDDNVCRVCGEKADQQPVMCGTCLSLTHSRCMGAGSCKETVQCLLCQRTTQHQSVRNQVRQNQKREAAKMLESARKKIKSAQVNDCVRVPVPIFDRAKTDQRNLLGVITEVDDKGMFTIATKHGLLAQKFSRNQF